MLFIGGTRDGLDIDINGDKIYFPVEQEQDHCIANGDKSVVEFFEKELYIKKRMYRNNRHIFSVMVKDGSKELLNSFIEKYNEANPLG
jgi:hypothetical protein